MRRRSVDFSGPARRRRRSVSTVTYEIPPEQERKCTRRMLWPSQRLDGTFGTPVRRRGAFYATPKTNGRCRSASAGKMSSFPFLPPHSLVPQTDGVERGDGESGERRRIKERGLHQATVAWVCRSVCTLRARTHTRTPGKHRRARCVAEDRHEQSFRC